MHDRCERPTNQDFHNYGARGIFVCAEWSGPYGFEAFLEDLGERPEGMSLDRVDNDGPYCKANCRWATASEQNRNQRPRRKR
jgi:hypothetical protein